MRYIRHAEPNVSRHEGPAIHPRHLRRLMAGVGRAGWRGWAGHLRTASEAPPCALDMAASVVAPILRSRGARSLVVRELAMTDCGAASDRFTVGVGSDPGCIGNGNARRRSRSAELDRSRDRASCQTHGADAGPRRLEARHPIRRASHRRCAPNRSRTWCREALQ